MAAECKSIKNTCCSSGSSCCGGSNDGSLNKVAQVTIPWISSIVDSPVGKIPQVKTRLQLIDTLGTWKTRWGIGRMNYRVAPGLYAVGSPSADSPVLISANYKLSFDRLRRELTGLNLWILVLDTKGINVWCAAGKGTFGTEELVKRVAQAKLEDLVSHRILIVPQLGAPGIAAHKVHKATGFKVVYGPVRASDIPEFLKSGFKATAAMREARFGFSDRLVLTPIELVGVLKPALISFVAILIINLAANAFVSFDKLIGKTISDFLPFLGAILIGAVIVPILLPYIPGRALAWKGWLFGILWAGAYLGLISPAISWLQGIIYGLLLPPIASFLAMNFTGATTYTSFSGVVKEMKIALPAQLISAALGVILLIVSIFFNN